MFDDRDPLHRLAPVAARRVEPVMGTIVSIDVRDPTVPPETIDAVFTQLHDIDARFSTYRLDSEISRLARGELAQADCSADVRHVLAACDHLQAVTGGAFDARHCGAEGTLDPSGFVKGWAVEEAAWLIDSAGGRNYWINAGGDVVVRGNAAPGRAWRVGIRHPDEADKVAAVLAVSDRAVATSGAYERGDHIAYPRTGRAPTGLRSVTVVGPGLAFTDAYATAIFVMALDGLPWLAAHPDYEAYAITSDDRAVWTAGMERYLALDAWPRQFAPATPPAGRRTTKRAPPSARLVASIRPPWRSTIQAAIASPNPDPPPGAPCAR